MNGASDSGKLAGVGKCHQHFPERQSSLLHALALQSAQFSGNLFGAPRTEQRFLVPDMARVEPAALSRLVAGSSSSAQGMLLSLDTVSPH